jgi:hypothetical protein
MPLLNTPRNYLSPKKKKGRDIERGRRPLSPILPLSSQRGHGHSKINRLERGKG